MSARRKKPKVWIGYLCRVALDHEVGYDRRGTQIFWSRTDWKNQLCSEECEPVRVELREVTRKGKRT